MTITHRTVLTSTIAAGLLAAGLLGSVALADTSYRALTAGNPDSQAGLPMGSYAGRTAVRPSVGAEFDRYHGIADGNRDLFGVELGTSTPTMLPDIYGPLRANPDLSF